MSATPDVLKRILADKAAEVTQRSAQQPLNRLRAGLADLPQPRGFLTALEARIAAGKPAVIAEIKQASPSQGLLRNDFDVGAIAASYARHGAACLSVLTDEKYFQGQGAYIATAKQACALPVLRKDFIIDPWQVYESRLLGADCILLIVAALGDAMLVDLTALAADLGMDTLVEVHDTEELERALAIGAPLIGINNRNLRSFQTDVQTTLDLLPSVPTECLLVTESGITTQADVARLRNAGVHAFLVGETFMRATDPGAKLRELFGS